MNLTPNDIEVLLHYHTSPSDHPRKDAPAVKSATDRFFREGMINEQMINADESALMTTARGKALVKMLCSTPFPEVAYIDPRTKEQVNY